MLALTLVILVTGQYLLLGYWLALFISIEFLNRQQIYLKSRFKALNLLYFIYLSFIILERGSKVLFPIISASKPNLDLSKIMVLNIVEHLAFALVVCTQLYFYFCIFSRQTGHKKWLHLKIVVLFNLLGMLNEVYQASFTFKGQFSFSAEALKDIFVNIAGSVLYFCLAMYWFGWISPEENITRNKL